MGPQIIPRKGHGVSRKRVSPNALRTLYRLHRHGFIAHLVGGCVRDLLLGRTPKDFDIGTNATPGQIKRLFRNCRLIGRRFRLAHLHFENEIIEVSTFRRAALPSDMEVPEEPLEEEERKEGEEKDEKDESDEKERRRKKRRFPLHAKDEEGMVLVDNVFGTPEEDAFRRDFTINALAYNIADASVIDYCQGIGDLQLKLIRPIGDPDVRFTEDPVRMLRAVRFAASHGFSIEPGAWESLCRLSQNISRVSPARLYEEIQKLFLLGSARPAFRLLVEGGLMAALFPGLHRWVGEEEGRLALIEENLGHLDRLCESGAPPTPALLLAALFGPGLESAALRRHREGIPRNQALEETCAAFTAEILKTVSVPNRVTGRLRAIISLQTPLRRTAPRRPASIVNRKEFVEALAYLRLTAEMEHEHRTPLMWWDSFVVGTPPGESPEKPSREAKGKKRRRRRRRRPRRPLVPPEGQEMSESPETPPDHE